MNTGYTSLIHTVGLFSDFDVEQANRVGDKCIWQRFSRGVEIVSQKEPSTDVFFVIEGRVCAKRYSLKGREVAYVEMGAGEMFGEFSAIDREPRSTAIETLEDSFVARMKSDDFRGVITNHPALSLRLAEHLVHKIRHLTLRVFEFSTMAVSLRIYAELVRMVDPEHDDKEPFTIEPAPSHYELATRLSTHREAVSRELSTLATLGILEIGRRRIKILDIPRLRRMAADL